MALPTTISGALVTGRGDCKPCLSSGGNVYVLLRDSTDNSLLEAWKATDPTVSFAEQNEAGKPDLTNTISALCVYQVGDVLHIATQESTTSRVAYHTFNMATDAWAIVNETVDAMGGTAVLTTLVSLVVRSDGDVIVLYAGALETVTMTAQQRVDYARREGGTWTAGIAVDNGGADDWLAGTAVLGSSDRSHFFFINDDVDDAYQRTLTSANALETFPASFDTSIQASASIIDFGPGTVYVSGGQTKIRVPYADASLVSVAQCDSADAPTVTVQAGVTATEPRLGTGLNIYLICAVASGTTLYLLWVDVTSQDLMYDSNADGAGFGTDQTLFTGTVARPKANVYTRSGTVRLAYLMHEPDDTTTKYNELDLGAAPSGARKYLRLNQAVKRASTW